MADDATAAALPTTLDPATLQRVLSQLMADPPPVASRATPSTREGRGFLSLLGEGLGGGQLVGSTAEREQGGLSALGAMGARMLQASDYSYQPHTFGSILGQGLGAASENLGRSQAISSARLAAAQEDAHQQQQDKIARLKEALPFLTLAQQQAAVRAMPGTLLGGGGAPGTGGDGSFLSALANIESGDTNIVSRVDKDSQGRTLAQGGNAQEISQGHFQIQTATWRDFAAKAGVDVNKYPTAMSAPREVQAQVASVIPLARFGPRTQQMLRQQFGDLDATKTIGALAGSRPAPAASTAATPPPTQAVPSAARPTLPPPGPAMAPPEAGTAQTAGPGGPTGTTIPASPPGSPGTVDAIKQGMVTAGADPATLAPGPGSRPGMAPGANVTAQLSPLPPGMDPNSREAYGILHPIVPPPDMRALFNPAPDPAQMAAIAVRKQNAENEYQAAKFSKDPVAAVAKARELLDKATADENTLRENARKLGVETQRGYYKEREAALDAAYAAEQKQRDEAAAASLQHDRALAAETHKTNETIRAADSAREGTYVTKERERFSNDREGTRTAIDQIDILGALSEKAGTAAPLELMTTAGGVPVSAVLGKMGLGDTATREHWGAQQAFNAVKNQMIIELRKGVQMGALSDRDMDFLKGMGPDLMQDPTTRKEILGLLEQVQRQKRTYLDTVENLYDDGHAGISWNTAKRQADAKMPPMVPSLPKEYTSWPPELRKEWKQKNLRPGQFVRDTEGNLGTYNPRGQ